MSTNVISLVPVDPLYVPSSSACERARERFRNYKLGLEAGEIDIELCDNIQFFSCGPEYDVRVFCSACRAEIPFDWWSNRMNDDYDGKKGGFVLSTYSTPCCGTRYTLNDLTYDPPQCFGSFAIEITDPSVCELDPKIVAEFEEMLGTRLREIFMLI